MQILCFILLLRGFFFLNSVILLLRKLQVQQHTEDAGPATGAGNQLPCHVRSFLKPLLRVLLCPGGHTGGCWDGRMSPQGKASCWRQGKAGEVGGSSLVLPS